VVVKVEVEVVLVAGGSRCGKARERDF
jgi:hypothetical protein